MPSKSTILVLSQIRAQKRGALEFYAKFGDDQLSPKTSTDMQRWRDEIAALTIAINSISCFV